MYNDLNPSFMSSTFNIKHVPYNFRDNQILTLPNFKNITYGKRSFKYYGAHVCNHIPVDTRRFDAKASIAIRNNIPSITFILFFIK